MNKSSCHVCSSKYKLLSLEPECYRCDKCGHIYRTFDGDAIEYHSKFYRKKFKRDKSEFDKDGKVNDRFHQARYNIVNSRVALLSSLLQPNDVCLDVGAGAGTFAKALLTKVKSVECTELDPKLIEECRRLGFTTYEKDFFEVNLPDKGYDWVFAWHVLEHVDNVKEFVSKMKRLSRNYVVVEIPTNRKVKVKFDGHYHLFSTKSLRQLFENCGLTPILQTEGIQSPSSLIIGQIQEQQ